MCKPRLSSTKIFEISPYLLQFYSGFILHWKILKKFTQLLSYVVCTQLRRHVHKHITKMRYREEKPRHLVFIKQILFTLGLGLTTPYSLGLLVWNFYRTFAVVCIEFWLRFEPQIRSTRLAINFLFITARAKRKVRLCVKSFDFLIGEYSLVWPEICCVLSQIQLIFLRGILVENNFGRIFQKFCEKPRLSSTKTGEISPYFLKFIMRPYCVEKFQKKSHRNFHMFFCTQVSKHVPKKIRKEEI